MSEHVYWMIQAAVKPGQFENLEALMEEMVAATQENEPGALNYEWSISEDRQTCHLYERYADSDATMVHLGNFGKNFAGRFMAALDIKSFVYYGNPNDEVKKALGGSGALHMSPFGGFAR